MSHSKVTCLVNDNEVSRIIGYLKQKNIEYLIEPSNKKSLPVASAHAGNGIEAPEPKQASPKKFYQRRFGKNKGPNGGRAADILVRFMQEKGPNHRWRLMELGQKLSRFGYAPNSASPLACTFVKQGIMERVDDGYYILTPAGLNYDPQQRQRQQKPQQTD